MTGEIFKGMLLVNEKYFSQVYVVNIVDQFYWSLIYVRRPNVSKIKA